ncbi:MAG: hypothetical protein ACOC44_17385 [Promethearchaeia archaeon]
MNEKPFFPDIFKEKLDKCDDIEDPGTQRDCKIKVLEDAVLKIGEHQKPVSWWLEVIAEGTKPLFENVNKRIGDLNETVNGVMNSNVTIRETVGEILQKMATKEDLKKTATKEDLDTKFNSLKVQMGKIRKEMATKEDVKQDIEKGNKEIMDYLRRNL